MASGRVRSHAVLFAGTVVLSVLLLAGVAFAVEPAPPGAPAWVSPAGGYVAKFADVTLIAGSETASLTVSLEGTLIASTECTAGQVVSLGRVAMRPGSSTFTVTASNASGEMRSFVYSVRRLAYPSSTSIVVDKSDFRLYWVRNDVLVKTYPIAHGKRRTPTPNALWKVGRKEKTPPRGVYGPRKLRLFRRVTYRTRRGRVVVRYRYTNYGIHGTNEPWVIGTMASHGCIRLTNSQILDLWPQVPVGTPVLTRQ